MDQLKESFENLLYPELRAYGREDRARLLREARNEPFDLVEWAGLLAALVMVVGITRYNVVGFGLADRFAVVLVNFLVAIPLLVATAGPFLLRRTKRGLRRRGR
jgi:hypothetical protein